MCGPAPKARRSPRLAADVEAVGIGVVAFVAVCGSEEDVESLTGGDVDAAELCVSDALARD